MITPRPPRQTPPATSPVETPRCPKCGSADTRLVGVSKTPPFVCIACSTCGHTAIIGDNAR